MWPVRVTRMSSGPSPRSARHRWPIERSGLSRQRPQCRQPKVKVQRWPSRCLRRLCPRPPVSRCPSHRLQSQPRARPRTRRRLCRAQRFGRCQPPGCCRPNQHLRSPQARNLSGAAPMPDGRRPNRRRAARRLPPCSACCVPNRSGATEQPEPTARFAAGCIPTPLNMARSCRQTARAFTTDPTRSVKPCDAWL